MQKRAAYPRLEREGRQRGNEKEVPGWNNKKMVGGGKQSGKTSDEVLVGTRTAACVSVMRFQTNGAAVSGIVTRKERVHLRAIAGVYLLLS